MMPTDPEERHAHVAEYVLGTLGEADRRDLEAALPDDAALRGELLFWQEKLLGLGARVPLAEPSDNLWPRIEAALPAVAERPAATAAAASGAAAGASGWWQRLGVWQGLSGLATAACVLLAAVLVMRPPVAGPQGPRYLAVLQSPDTRNTGWVVEADTGGRLRLVPVGPTGTVPPGRALQFWTKAQGAAGPTSLGLVAAGQRVELPVTQLPSLGDAQLFEITLEPEGGSTIGRPTGPILFVGTSFEI